jgi:predicted RNase H-like HicB family nuclease
VSYVPQLGLSDFGTTVEETMENTQEAIEVYIESLVAHGQSVPASSDSFYLIAESSVKYPQSTSV